MPRFILAGVPQGELINVKRALRDLPAWTDQDSVTHELVEKHKDLLGIANEPTHDGAHILALYKFKRSDFQRVRQRFFDIVADRHRVVWLDYADFNINLLSATEFRARLRAVIEFELEWRRELRPTQASPLLLPECSFEPSPYAPAVWERVRGIDQNSDYTLSDARKSLAAFGRLHRTRRGWRDAKRFIYKAGTDAVPDDRSLLWKFAYRIQPDSFHWDVRAEDDRPFKIRCVHGMSLPFPKYTNVDCHGYVRPPK